MRLLLVLLALPAFAWQSEKRTVVFDPEGRAAPWAVSAQSDGRGATSIRDLHGRPVNVEDIEERVLEDRDGRRVVERTIRRRAPDGAGLPAERVRVETTTRPDGASSSSTTVYRADLNGRFQLAERSTAESRKLGETVRAEMVLERPTLNGGFETVERRVTMETTRDKTIERTETAYRPDTNGRFAEVARQVSRQWEENGALREQVDEYETVTSGVPQLARQTTVRTVTGPLGEQRREVEIFGAAAPGRVATPGQFHLRERQITERAVTADGAVETFSIQRPSLESARELGPPVKISETVCKGKCLDP